MCGGGGGSSKPPTPTSPTLVYGVADYSNQQKQAAAIETDKATRQGAYGSELATSAPNNTVKGAM
jgi:hypothetical protein